MSGSKRKAETEPSKEPSSRIEAMEAVIAMMSEEDATKIYNAAVSRINGLRRVKTAQQMSSFEKGDKVVFAHQGKTITGTVKSINQKTVSLQDCSDGMKWRVGPSSLRKQ